MEIKLQDGDIVELNGRKYEVKAKTGIEPKLQLYY